MDWKERYHCYLQSAEWKEKRRQVWRRAKGRCEGCKAQAKEMHIHHLTYDRIYNESLDDLRLYCRACHLDAHGIGMKEIEKQIEEFFRGTLF